MRRTLKETIKKIFNTFGFEIHSKNTMAEIYRKNIRTNLEEIIDHALSLGFRPQTIIDVGVADGTFPLYEKFPYATHLLIEPLKEHEEALKKISQRYKAVYVLAAAGSKAGKIIINVHPDLVSSSIFKEAEGGHADGIPREVPVFTIDELCEQNKLGGPYLVKIDTQGAELEILKGAEKVLRDAEMIILEVHLFQFFIGGPQVYDVVNYMKGHGFVLYDIFGGYYRPLDNALAAKDMSFVKEKGKFRKLHFFATLDQRKELTKKALSSLYRDNK